MSEVDPKFIQNPVRLGDSKLWEIQRNYFATMGVEAWKEEVPFYISSNAFTSHQYAHVVFHFMRDYVKNNPHTSNSPFYILELGAGTGKFSFHFIKSLNQLIEIEKAPFQFCYVISDIIQKNLDFCEKSPCLAPFFQAQHCDLTLFNIEESQDFYLMKTEKNYSELKSKKPLIIIANYVFDCTKQDAFEYDNGVFKEVRLGLNSRYSNFNIKEAKHLDDLKLKFEKSEINIDNYYDSALLNGIIKSYADVLKEQSAVFMFPLGGIQFLENIKALTHNNFFMISGDKGFSLAEKLPIFSNESRISYDGCYSFMVNFHALGTYLTKQGGDYYPTNNSNHFKVNLFCDGTTFENLPQTRKAFADLEALGPDEYCYIYDEVLTSGYRFDFKGLISFLRMSRWDPSAYSIIHDRLMEQINTAGKQILSDFPSDIKKVKENIYSINYGTDAYMLLGYYHQTQNEDDDALANYEKSLEIFGDTAATHNNMAMIYEKRKNFAKALEHYQKSLELDKKNVFAKRKILKMIGKPSLAMVMPFLKGIFLLLVLIGTLYLLFR